MRFRSARADSGASNTTTEEPVETFDIDDQLETTEPELVEEDLGNDLEETTAFPEELTTQEEETSQEEETTLEEELEEETTTSEEEPELNTTTLPKLPGTTTLPDIIPATTSAPRRRKLTTLPDIIPLTTSLPPVVNTTVRRKKRPAKTTLADIVPALNINVTITTTTPKIKTKKKVKLKTTVTKKVTTVAIGPTTVATSAPVINLAVSCFLSLLRLSYCLLPKYTHAHKIRFFIIEQESPVQRRWFVYCLLVLGSVSSFS